MQFATHGGTFTFDGRYLSRWESDVSAPVAPIDDPLRAFDGQSRLVSCADLSLYLYGPPTCADAFRIAHEMMTNPAMKGR